MLSLIKNIDLSFSPNKKTIDTINDFINGVKSWRIWIILALADIRTRYRRSKLGQFWITISMGVTILSLAVVYSSIFKIDLAAYLPTLALSIIVWGLIAALVNDATSIFIQSENLILSSPLPISTCIFRMLLRNIIIFGHNLVLVPIVMISFGIVPSWPLLLFIPVLILSLLNGIWLAMLLGIICSRFRDLPQIIASIVQIAFFISPVIWSRSQLRESQQYIVDWNPFAIFLELLRDPWLGTVSSLSTWIMAIAITSCGFLIAIPFFIKFRARIAYYL